MVLSLLLSPLHKNGMAQIGLLLQSGSKKDSGIWRRGSTNMQLTGNVIDKLTFVISH